MNHKFSKAGLMVITLMSWSLCWFFGLFLINGGFVLPIRPLFVDLYAFREAAHYFGPWFI